MIHEVYEEGAAARDGRLWAGDQILEVSECLYACACSYLLSCVLLFNTVQVSCRGKRDDRVGSVLKDSFLSLRMS